MIRSSISLLPELLALQQSGDFTDTLLVGQDGRVMVHWAALARWTYWRGLREEGERGPVTIILPGVGREELGDIVEKVYGEVKGENGMVDDMFGDDEMYDQQGLNDVDVIVEDNHVDKIEDLDVEEYKLEVESIGEIEDDYHLDGMAEEEDIDDEELAIEKFTNNLPDYIVFDREAISKAFSYIQSTPMGEKHKSGPWAGREKYMHECGFVDNNGVKCGFKKGVGVRYLMRHTQGHVHDIYWCTLCKKSMKRTMGHIKSKHTDRSKEKTLEERLEESNLCCNECQRNFLTQKSLDYHVNRIHKNNLKFSCAECDYRGMTKRQINNHIRVKHLKSDLCPCYICGKELADRSHLDNHLLLHGEATYSCEFCGLKFKTGPSLNLHKKNTHLEKKFICEYCSKKFSIKSSHDKHVVSVHTNIRNFACNQCDAKCTTKANLRRHSVIHSDEKPFVCKECGRRFKVNEALIRHKLVHTGEKPYGCGQCSFRCQQSYDLTKHYKKVHDMIVKNPKAISQDNLAPIN